jgi:hypothetical protein
VTWVTRNAGHGCRIIYTGRRRLGAVRLETSHL